MKRGGITSHHSRCGFLLAGRASKCSKRDHLRQHRGRSKLCELATRDRCWPFARNMSNLNTESPPGGAGQKSPAIKHRGPAALSFRDFFSGATNFQSVAHSSDGKNANQINVRSVHARMDSRIYFLGAEGRAGGIKSLRHCSPPTALVSRTQNSWRRWSFEKAIRNQIIQTRPDHRGRSKSPSAFDSAPVAPQRALFRGFPKTFFQAAAPVGKFAAKFGVGGSVDA
jgi:hypothetical protein